jgi:hypothetical protein
VVVNLIGQNETLRLNHAGERQDEKKTISSILAT